MGFYQYIETLTLRLVY